MSTAVGGVVDNCGRFPPPPTPPPHHHPLLGAGGRPKSTGGCDPALPAGTTIFVSTGGGLKQTASEVLSQIPDFDTSSVRADVPGSTVDQTTLPDVDKFMTLIEGAGSDDEMNDTGMTQQSNNPKSVLI